MNTTLSFVFLTVLTVTLGSFQNSYVTSLWDNRMPRPYSNMEVLQSNFILFSFSDLNKTVHIGQYDKDTGILLNEYEYSTSTYVATTASINSTFYLAFNNATMVGGDNYTNIPYTVYTVIVGLTVENGTLVEVFKQLVPVTVTAMAGSPDDTLIVGGLSDNFEMYKITRDDGLQVWSRKFPGTPGTVILDILVDGSGTIYATGTSSTGFPPYPPRTQGDRDIWILKMDSDALTNTTTVIGTSGYFDQAQNLVLTNGSLYFAGTMDGLEIFQNSVSVANLSYIGYSSIVVMKLNLDLQFVAVTSYGSSQYNFAIGASVDIEGNILVFAQNGDQIPGVEGTGTNNVAKFRPNLQFIYLYQTDPDIAGTSLSAKTNNNTYYIFGLAPNSKSFLTALSDLCMSPSYCQYSGTTGMGGSTTGESTTDPGTSSTPSPGYVTEPNGSSKNDNTAIIAGVVGGGAGLLGISAIAAFLVIRKKRTGEPDQELNENMDSPGTVYSDLPNKSSVRSRPSSNLYGKNMEDIGPQDIVVENRLGGGYFGEVYKGLWHGTTPVALKRLKDPTMLTEFLREAAVLQNLSMPYIVRYFGIWTDKEGCKYIVTEFMSKGSLKDFLDQHEKTLKVTDLILMAKDIAAGMKFMASKDFIHRDLAARNILVKEEEGRYVAKVADFGLARLAQNNYYTKGGTIPIRWSSPEVLTKEKFSTKSDVWAYAILLWEMFEFGKLPYVGKSNEEVCHMVLSGHRLSQPDQCPAEVWDLVQRCWALDPQDRPTFDEVHIGITDIATNYGIYSPSQPKIALPAPITVNNYDQAVGEVYKGSNEESLGNYNTIGE